LTRASSGAALAGARVEVRPVIEPEQPTARTTTDRRATVRDRLMDPPWELIEYTPRAQEE
jgi:hypothetical protein